MLPGAKLLLGLPQPFGRVERPAKAAFDVGAVFLGALAQGDVGQPLVGVDAAAGGVHRAGMLHRHPVGLIIWVGMVRVMRDASSRPDGDAARPSDVPCR